MSHLDILRYNFKRQYIIFNMRQPVTDHHLGEKSAFPNKN